VSSAIEFGIFDGESMFPFKGVYDMRAFVTHRLAVASLAVCCAGFGFAGPASADPVSASEARDMLFDRDQVEVVVYDTSILSDDERAIVTQIARNQRYYAAMALAPSEGLMSAATVMAANYHDISNARTAALAECDRLRTEGRPCAIVLEVRPSGWQAQALQLNADATEAFDQTYRRGRGTRAFATSAATGLWGIGTGAAAAEEAVAACESEGTPTDCEIVIAD
jgi:hypothetical protein